MKLNGYEIDAEFIVPGTDRPDWRSSGLGDYIIGRKNGVRWFIKRNNEYRFPTVEDEPDKEMRDYDLIPAQRYQAERETLCRLLVKEGKLSASKDHVVAEVEHFISSKRIVLVSQFVENIATDADFTTMEAHDFVEFCAATAELLVKVHACGVVHGDLKVGQVDDIMSGNIVAAVEKGKLIPYLIDFDLSFPAPPAKNPDSIPHSENYESPEIVPYIDGEDAAKCAQITTATDIFTLGIVFHKLWTGSFPATESEDVSAGRCVAEGKEVIINKKFDVKLGENCGATFMSLLNWMFARNPAERPTAQQVVDVLSDRLEVPDAYHKGSDVKLFSNLWESDQRAAERLPKAELTAMGVESFRSVTDGGVRKYMVRIKGGGEQMLTLKDVIAKGYAVRKPAALCTPWEEHGIDLVSPEEMSAKGYIEIKRTPVENPDHKYMLMTASGVKFVQSYRFLLSEGLATTKPVKPIDAATPWPGDGAYASPEFLASRKIVKISRVEMWGIKGYRVDFDGRRPLEFVDQSTMKKLRYLV